MVMDIWKQRKHFLGFRRGRGGGKSKNASKVLPLNIYAPITILQYVQEVFTQYYLTQDSIVQEDLTNFI